MVAESIAPEASSAFASALHPTWSLCTFMLPGFSPAKGITE